MYSVLIVDDEPLMLQMLPRIASWKAEGFEIVAEARDGLEALDVMRSRDIDLLVTDLKMPVMGGLELIRQATEIRKDLFIVVLSSYNEFELVREAFTLGAGEYVLKPEMEEARLTEVIRKARVSLDRERAEIERITSLSSLVTSNRTVLRDEFWAHLIWEGTDRKDRPEEIAEELGINLPGGAAGVAVVSVDRYDQTVAGRDAEAIRAIHDSVHGIADSAVDESGLGSVASLNERSFVIIYDADAARTASGSQIVPVLDRVRRSAHLYLDLSVSAALGPEVASYRQLGGAVHAAMSALEMRFFAGPGSLLTMERAPDEGPVTRVEPSTLAAAVVDAVAAGDRPGALSALARHHEAFRTATATPPREIRAHCADVIRSLGDLVSDRFGENAAIPGVDLEEAASSMLRAEFLADLHEALREAVEAVIELIGKTQESRYALLMYRAQAYLREHFTEAISLSQVAEHFGMADSHFSRVFHQETGVKFVDYLTRLRMERAIARLRSSNVKAYELAHELGYTSAGHFCKLFRKYTGMNVSEFR